jgi:hypothetical protein
MIERLMRMLLSDRRIAPPAASPSRQADDRREAS